MESISGCSPTRRRWLITIRRNAQYTPSAGTYITSPKNGKARTVDVGPDVLKLLQQLRQEQAGKAISRYVFTQEHSPDIMSPKAPPAILRSSAQSTALRISTRTSSGIPPQASRSPTARMWCPSANGWDIVTRRSRSECTPTPMRKALGGPVRLSGTLSKHRANKQENRAGKTPVRLLFSKQCCAFCCAFACPFVVSRNSKSLVTVAFVVIRNQPQINIISWQSIVHNVNILVKMVLEEVFNNGTITFL